MSPNEIFVEYNNYTQEKFRSGSVWGPIGGTTPWPSVITSHSCGREIAPMFLGGRRPWFISALHDLVSVSLTERRYCRMLLSLLNRLCSALRKPSSAAFSLSSAVSRRI